MRIGTVLLPAVDLEGSDLRRQILDFAHRCEGLEFCGIWVLDVLGRGFPTIDPLIMLAYLASITEKIELGTGILQVPLRHPVELAHRVQSLNALTRGRLRLGIGAGSTKGDFDIVEADFSNRFKALSQNLSVMRRVWKGEPVYGPALPIWPFTEGGPSVLLGAWRSTKWIEMAARECDGWIGSGIYSDWEDLELGIRKYRDHGDGRVVVANIFSDFREVPIVTPMIQQSRINLICDSAEARSRLLRLASIGVDDALLILPFDDLDQLEIARDLWTS